MTEITCFRLAGTSETVFPSASIAFVSLPVSRGDCADAVLTSIPAKKLLTIKIMRFRWTSLFTADVLSEHLSRAHCLVGATRAFFVRKAIGDCQSFLPFQNKLLFTCQCTDARRISITTSLVSAAAWKVESK
jgi:hypothetical protein